MDDQGIKRASWGSMKFRSAAHGFFRAVLIGALVFGIPLALYGVHYSLSNPPIIHGKGGDERNTVLGWAANLFCAGGMIGGFAGAISWVVLVVIDQIEKLFPKR